MQMLGWSILAAVPGYIIGLLGGWLLSLLLSTNTHDKAIEVGMSSIFVYGPMGAVLGFVGTLIWLMIRG